MTNTAQIPRTTTAGLRLVQPLVQLAEAFSSRRNGHRDTRDGTTGAHRPGYDTGRRDPDARAGDRHPATADELPPPRPGSARAAIPIPLPGEPVDTSQHRPSDEGDAEQDR